ncbi:MAG: [LysW]-aminoadipate kinase [Arenicellales bacterium]
MLIVKIGGGESINLSGVMADLAELKDEPLVIVHGANALRDRIASRMGFEKRVLVSTSGYSSVFSDETALDAILMAYSGLRNKRIVELCQQHGINAVGLTGLDGRLIRGRRNKGIRVRENGKNLIKRDLSGKPAEINTDFLLLLLDNGYTPVLTIPIADERFVAINSENDDLVCLLQQALSADTVIQLIEAPGFMDDVEDPSSLHATLSRAQVAEMEERTEGRMKRKMHALNKLVQGGVQKVIICDGRTEHPVRDGLAGAGTWIR